MKLLAVTGVINSSWWSIYSALTSPMKKLDETIPKCSEFIQDLEKQEDVISTSNFSQALGLNKNKHDYIFCDEKHQLNLVQWGELPQFRVLVFYSNPITTLAKALSQQNLSLDECYLVVEKWAEEINSAFRFYQQHKNICLLLDAEDAITHRKLASESISGFVGQDIALNDSVNFELNNLSPHSIIAANLLLSDRDDLFEIYDEIRSSAPIFEDFQLSGFTDNKTLANDALDAIQASRKREVSAKQKAEQLSASQEALKTSEAKVVSLQGALEQANKKHQEALTAAEQQKSALAANLEQKTKQLTGSEANAKQKTEQLSASQEALKTSEAKVVSSQGALAQANKKHQEALTAAEQQKSALAANLEQKTKQINEIEASAKKEYINLENENKLLVLQVEQLQEELETTIVQSKNRQEQHAKELTQKNTQLAECNANESMLVQKASTLQEAMDAHKNEGVAKLTSMNEQAELYVLQIAQLEEELETIYLSNEHLNKQYEEKAQLLANQSDTQQQMQSIDAENEIATLQINQLQEELEFYYQQVQEKESTTLLTQLVNTQPYQNVFEQASFGSFEIKGAYDIDGYQDIQLSLNNVQLADGRKFPALNVKLIEVSGRPGIEFRPSKEDEESANLQWREDMQDEYGSFIRYIPYPNSEQLELQQKTDESLCASDRLLVLSIASRLADVFQMTVDSDLPEGKLRDWKLIAIDLQSQVAKLPNWMSFDALTLVEEMRTDNYEHLWLRFNSLLVNDHLRPEFEVKFAVTELVEDEDVFSKKLMLEIRQQDNQLSPLQAWPPVSQDEYGYKLQALVDLTENELNIHVEEKLSDSDYQFLLQLLKNMVNFLQVLAGQGQNLERPIQDWLALGNRITEISEVKSEVTSDVLVDAEPEQSAIIKLEASFNEHIDLGGYQHLVYQQSLSDSEVLLFKIRAENINLQTKTAELYLELRTGNNQVPLADSEFFDEDEFGPRVLLPLAFLQSDLFKQQMRSPDIKLINIFSEEMNNLIETNSELDEAQRALWLAMLEKK